MKLNKLTKHELADLLEQTQGLLTSTEEAAEMQRVEKKILKGELGELKKELSMNKKSMQRTEALLDESLQCSESLRKEVTKLKEENADYHEANEFLHKKITFRAKEIGNLQASIVNLNQLQSENDKLLELLSKVVDAVNNAPESMTLLYEVAAIINVPSTGLCLKFNHTIEKK